MENMKVAMYYNNNDVRIERMPIPEISDNELLVKVIASGICGSDVMEWYRLKKAPLVLGHEISGTIEKIGEKLIVLHKESRNGTFVNGKRVQAAELNDEDIVKFGKELNLKVFTFSSKQRASAVTEEHDDKSAVFSTIERTLAKL